MSSIAVVILNWNGREHLNRFMPSIIKHTPLDVDIIVADNGSTDGSVELLRSNFPTVKIKELGENHGFAKGYNLALQDMEYDYVALLNSDVEVSAGWIEPLVRALDADPNVAALSPKILSLDNPNYFEYAGASGGFIDSLGYPFCRGRIVGFVEEDGGQYNNAREVFWCSGAAFVCRLKVFREFGGFDPHFFAHMEEIDLCWRMQLEGYIIRVEPTSKVYHLGGGTLGGESPYKTFLNHRNNLAMMIRCSSFWQLVWVAMFRPGLDFLAMMSYLFAGRRDCAVAVFKAYGELFRWMPRLMKERYAIRANYRTEPNEIYRGSILWRYACGLRQFSSLRL